MQYSWWGVQLSVLPFLVPKPQPNCCRKCSNPRSKFGLSKVSAKFQFRIRSGSVLGSVIWCYVTLLRTGRHPLKDVLCAAQIADDAGSGHTRHWRLSCGLLGLTAISELRWWGLLTLRYHTAIIVCDRGRHGRDMTTKCLFCFAVSSGT